MISPMHTRAIPSTGALLPVIGCGTWLGFDVGSRPRELPSRGEVLATLFESGGSVVDSSPMYGSAEQVVGDLLEQGGSRTKAFLATKVWTSGKRAGIKGANDDTLVGFTLRGPDNKVIQTLDHPTSGNFSVRCDAPGVYTFVFDNTGIIRSSARKVSIKGTYQPD